MRPERLFALAHRLTVGAAMGAFVLLGGQVAHVSGAEPAPLSAEGGAPSDAPQSDAPQSDARPNDPPSSDAPPNDAPPSEAQPSEQGTRHITRAPVGGTLPVGMCGAHGQSIEAPPPIYPTPLATAAGCALGGEEFSSLSPTRSGDQLQLSGEQQTDSAILHEEFSLSAVPSARAERAEPDAVAAEEHPARRRRPPRD